MKTIIFFLLIILSTLTQKHNLPLQIEKEAVASLIGETKNLMAPYAHAMEPQGLIQQLKGYAGHELFYCDKSYLNEALKGFPQNIIEDVKKISSSQQTEFQTFQEFSSEFNNKQHDDFGLYQLVGIARANETDVQIGLVYSTLNTTLIQQYKTEKECHKCGLIKTCCSEVKKPISVLPQQQLLEIDDYMAKSGYQIIYDEIPKSLKLENHQIEEFNQQSVQDE